MLGSAPAGRAGRLTGFIVEGATLAGAAVFVALTAWTFRPLVAGAWGWIWKRLGFTTVIFAPMAFLLVQRSIRVWQRGTESDWEDLEKAIAWLQIGAPMIGMLGTITGLYRGFGALAAAGHDILRAIPKFVEAARLALFTTGAGLAIAFVSHTLSCLGSASNSGKEEP